MSRLTDKGRLALDFIIGASKALTKDEIAKGAGLSVRGIATVLNKLVKDGYVAKTIQGVYILASSAREEVAETIKPLDEQTMEVAGGVLTIYGRKDERVNIKFEAENQYIMAYSIAKEQIEEVVYYINALADLDVSYMFLKDYGFAELVDLYERTQEELLDQIKPYASKRETQTQPNVSQSTKSNKDGFNGQEIYQLKNSNNKTSFNWFYIYIISYIASFVKTFGKKKYGTCGKQVPFGDKGGHFGLKRAKIKASFGVYINSILFYAVVILFLFRVSSIFWIHDP